MIFGARLDGLGGLRGTYLRWNWACLILTGIILTGLVEYLETERLTAAIRFEQLFVFHLAASANLLLAISTLLYVAHLWFATETVGRWASGLATFGALASMLAVVTRWLETYFLQRPGHIPLSSMYELITFFSTLTVLIYLAMERVYRSRTAGAFVMPIVLFSVLFQAWLLAHEI